MNDSLRIWLSSLQKNCKSFLKELKHPSKAFVGHRRSRHPKIPLSPSSSKFNTSTPSSFPASETQLRQVFDLIDANGDGKISPSELGRVLSRLRHIGAVGAADEEARGMVEEMDCDGDGHVDLDEFLVAVLSGDDDLMDAFLIFDADKDGLISAKELQMVLVGLGREEDCSIEDCRRMIGGVDRDGDGFVNFEEFRSMMTGCIS